MQTGSFNKRNELIFNLENKKTSIPWANDIKNINTNNRKTDLKKEFEELKNRVKNVGNQRLRSEVRLWGNKEQDNVSRSSWNGFIRNSSKIKSERENNMNNICIRERKSLNLLVSQQSSTIHTPTSSYQKSQNNLIIDAFFSFNKLQDSFQKNIFSKLSFLSTRIMHLKQLIPQLYLRSSNFSYSIKHYQLTISQLQHSNKSLVSLNSSMKLQLQSQRTKYESQRSYYLNQIQSLLLKSTSKLKQSQLKYEKIVTQYCKTIQQLNIKLQKNEQYQLNQLDEKDLKIQQQKEQITKYKQQLYKKQIYLQKMKDSNNRLEKENQKFITEVNIQMNKLEINQDYKQKNIHVRIQQYLKISVQKQINYNQQKLKLKQDLGVEILNNNFYQIIFNLNNIIKQLQTQIQSKNILLFNHKNQSQSLQSTIYSLKTLTIPSLQSKLLSISSENTNLFKTISNLQSTSISIENSKRSQIQTLTKACQNKDRQIKSIVEEFNKYKEQINYSIKALQFKNEQFLQRMKVLNKKYQQQINKLEEQKQKYAQKYQDCKNQFQKILQHNNILQQKLKIKIQKQNNILSQQQHKIQVIQQLNNQQQKILHQIKQIQQKQQKQQSVNDGKIEFDDFRINAQKQFHILGDYNNSDNFDIGQVEVKRVEEREITDFFLKLKYAIERMVQGEHVNVDIPKEIEKQWCQLMELIQKLMNMEWSVIQGWEESRQIGDSIMEGLQIDVKEIQNNNVINESISNKKDYEKQNQRNNISTFNYQTIIFQRT